MTSQTRPPLGLIKGFRCEHCGGGNLVRERDEWGVRVCCLGCAWEYEDGPDGQLHPVRRQARPDEKARSRRVTPENSGEDGEDWREEALSTYLSLARVGYENGKAQRGGK